MSMERQVTQHYAHGSLEQAILDALASAGHDIEHLKTTDLAGVDEFHQGGRGATAALAKDLGVSAGMTVLDIGSGLGGPARHLAESFGCIVSGIDLTPEYVDVARSLSRRCGLADRVSFQVGSALDLPFPDDAFDRAIMLHVGMNVEDKRRAFTEVHRVLKSGGRFGVYDVTSTSPDRITYPVPWAQSADTSFVASPDVYRSLLTAAGFQIEAVHDRSQFCLEVAARRREQIARQGEPPVGQHLLMGAAVKDRQRNILAALEAGIIAPIAFIARAVP